MTKEMKQQHLMWLSQLSEGHWTYAKWRGFYFGFYTRILPGVGVQRIKHDTIYWYLEHCGGFVARGTLDEMMKLADTLESYEELTAVT